MVDDFQILPRGMKNLHDSGVGHQFEEGFQIQPLGHGINDHFQIRACHLYQAELRPECRFPQELGIHGYELRLRKLLAGIL